jgi:altronate dehydratase
LKLALKLHTEDNVATVTEALAAGEAVSIRSTRGTEVERVAAADGVPLPFHKIALLDIVEGAPLLKYGEIIGYASAPIARGDWVHVHNVQSANLPEEEA